jgi:hypothetical protein
MSGGQTGVDRAALDFALHNNMLCRGWCPLGRQAEDGPIKALYPLNETFSSDPKVRTEMNVMDSDATLIIVISDMDQGTQFAHDIARLNDKPVFIWEIDKNRNIQQFKNWLIYNSVSVLNIAGPRENFAPGIYNETLDLLEILIGDYHS